MKKVFRIGLAQINPVVGDLSYNEQLIAAAVDDAESRECDIVFFPELSLCGYPPEDLMLEPQFIMDNQKHLRKLSRLSATPMFVVGYVEGDSGKLYNSAALIANGKLLHSYRKVCLPNYGVFDEQRYFASGDEIPLYRVDDFGIGINICEDIWINPGPGDLQAAQGAGLVVTINSSPYHVRKSHDRIEMLRKFAKRNQVFYAYVNLVGGQDELVFDGSSVVIEPDGEVIALGEMFREDLIVVDIPVEDLRKSSRRRKLTPHLSKAAESFPAVQRIQVPYELRPKTKRIRRKKVDATIAREEEIYYALIVGTSDYIWKNDFTDVVVGLSGGIDSALTAVIAHDIVGTNHLHLVFMPSRYTSKESTDCARKLSQNLGVKLVEYEIDELFELYKKTLADTFKGLPEDVAEENIQARIRGNILMALANKFNWLVLTTGNKSEIAVGYCTLYGDTAGGYSVIKDVYKTMVFRLARWINRMTRKVGTGSLIPPLIITKQPSAELRADQKDIDVLPPYDVLDEILKLYIEDGESPREIAKLGHDLRLVKRIVRLVDANEYKRRQAAPGVKITPRALGKDRRMPITNRYKFE